MNICLNKNNPHMPLSELGNDSKSVWAKIFAKEKKNTSHYEAGFWWLKWGEQNIKAISSPQFMC